MISNHTFLQQILFWGSAECNVLFAYFRQYAMESMDGYIYWLQTSFIRKLLRVPANKTHKFRYEL